MASNEALFNQKKLLTMLVILKIIILYILQPE